MLFHILIHSAIGRASGGRTRKEMHVIGHQNVMADAPAIGRCRFFPDLAQDFVALRVGEQPFSLVRASRHENNRVVTERRNMRQMSMLPGRLVHFLS